MSIKEEIAVTLNKGKEGVVRTKEKILRQRRDCHDEKCGQDTIQNPEELMQLLNVMESLYENISAYLNIPQYRREPGRKGLFVTLLALGRSYILLVKRQWGTFYDT